MIYPEAFTDYVLQAVFALRSQREWMHGMIGTDHGVCEIRHSVLVTGYVDIVRDDDKWMEVSDLIKQVFDRGGTNNSKFGLEPQHAAHALVPRLAPGRSLEFRRPRTQRPIAG